MPPRILPAPPLDTRALVRGWSTWFAGLRLAVPQARGDARSTPPDTDIDERLRRARSFIDRSFDQPIDLDDIARQACLSRYHFLRSFRRIFDETPHQYLTRKRIERAKKLLTESDLPVTEICFEVGFHSLGSFSTLFQRHVGHAPGRYRRHLVQSPGLPRLGPAIPACFLAIFRQPARV